MNDSGTGAEFRIRSNWCALITTALIYPIVLIVGAMQDWNVFALSAMVGVGVFVQVVVMIVVHIYLALMMPKEPDDERDLMLSRRASSISGTVLLVGVWCVLIVMVARAMMMTAQEETHAYVDMIPIYALFGAIILAELTRYVMTILSYRIR